MTLRDRHRFSRSRSHSDNPRYSSNSHSDSCRSHSRSLPLTLSTQHIMPQKLEHIPILLRHYHTADPHHAGVSPEMTVDPGHAHPANTITKPQKDPLPVHTKHPGIPKTGSTNKSQLMTCPQSIIALMNRTVIQRMI